MAGGWKSMAIRVVVALSTVGSLAVLVAPTAAAAGDPVRFSPVPVASWRIDGVGYATLVVGDTVYVGGTFGTARDPRGGTATGRANLAAFDLRTGALRTNFVANTNGSVPALAYSQGRLFVGGSFTRVNGVTRQRLAAVDPTTGAVLGGWRADVNSNVYALSVGGGRVFLAGSFSSVAGTARSRVAAVSVTTAAVAPYAPVLNGTANALVVDAAATRVYFGGDYTTVNGRAASRLTRTDGNGNVLPITWASLGGPALRLELEDDGSRLAVAVGGAGNQGAWYDTSTGRRLWNQRCEGDAQAVHIVAGSVFTGFHDACGGDTSQHLTSNASATGQRDGAFRPTFDRFWGVRAISGDTSALVVAGDFTRISGVPVSGFAIFPNPTEPPPGPPPPSEPGGGDGYDAAVRADHPSWWWRLGESGGSAVTDASGNGVGGTYRTGVTLGVPGAVAGDTAVSGPGTSGIAYADAASTVAGATTIELWFRSTSTRGGKLIGIEDVPVGWGNRQDRQLYLTGDGRLVAGVVAGGQRRTVATAASYTDGAWHHAAVTVGTAGVRLYVDGALRGSLAVTADAASGFWRVGGGNLTGWPDRPASSAIAGSVDEVAVYPVELDASRIAAHHDAA